MQKSTTRQEELAEKRRFWKEHFDTWKAGGLKPSDYCRQHHLKIHSFWYWKKKFADLQSPGTSFVQIYPPQALKLGPACHPPSPLRLLVGNYKIEVPSGFDPVTLKQLVHTLARL